MAARLDMLDAAFLWVLRATLQASVVVAVVMLARLALGRRISPGARYALWLLLALPGVAPFLPAGPFHLPTTSRPASPITTPVTGSSPPGAAEWKVVYEPFAALPKAAAPAIVQPPRFNVLRSAAVAWAAGAFALALRVAFTHARVVRRARRAPPVTGGAIGELLDDCRRAVGTRRRPRLVAPRDDATPALLGLFRPRLLLPDPLLRRLGRAELRFVLLHELIHLKRLDVLGEWLLTLVQVGHWFNPLLWVAAVCCRADRELACDAAVLALTGDSNRADYGRTILRLATELSLPARLSPAVGILETHSPLERRLRMIAETPERKSFRWALPLVALVTVAVVACTNQGSGARAQSQSQPKSPPETNRAKPQAAAPSKGTPPADVPNAKQEVPNVTAAPKVDRAAGARMEGDADAQRRKAQAVLDRTLPEVKFDENTFVDVVDFLRDVSGANIFVNWKALQAAGVERNTPVTARLRDIKFSKALSVILDAVAGGVAPLGYTIDDGVITISTVADLEKDTVTRVYDVRDLMITIPDFTPPPDLLYLHGPENQGGADRDGRPKEPDPNAARAAAVESVIRLIQDTIASDKWDKTFGIRELQGQLIVTATPKVHEQIIPVLEQLRDARSVQVSVEARFISVDDAVLAALPQDLRDAVAGQLRGARDPVPVDGDPAAAAKPPANDPAKPATQPAGADTGKFVYLDAAQTDALIGAVRTKTRLSIVTAPRITLFNGQTAYVLVSTQRAYVADLSVVKEKDGATRYEPVIGTAQAGVLLRAGATVSFDRKYATLTLRPRLTELVGMEEVPWHANVPGEHLTVQRPKILASELATTVSVPDRSTVLLGGLKSYDAAEGDAAPTGKPHNVLLLVRPTLIVQREVQAPQFPLLEKKGKGEGGE